MNIVVGNDTMARNKTVVSAKEAMPKDGKPTLKTIALMSGLAVPTVSRALNDAPDIGAKTKELVRKIAADIGYVPNRAGVRLRTGRTNVISLVISTEHKKSYCAHDFFHRGRLRQHAFPPERYPIFTARRPS
ncbi:MAG: LacI family DNA-binding transcriptional regulator [Yoonia sp.]